MTDTNPDPTRWLAGFGGVLVVVITLLVLFAVGIEGVGFPAVGASSGGFSGGPNTAIPSPTTTAPTGRTTSGARTSPTTRSATASTRPATATTHDASVVKSWHRYRTIVVFRDDDVQAYWRADALRKVHRVFLDAHVPLTDAVIPAIGNGTITDDARLCSYLSSLRRRHPGQFEYALHGYTHAERTNFHGGSEFGGVPYRTQRKWLRKGKRIVAGCTGETPTTFVPPFNTYDTNTTRALKATNFTLLSGGSWFTSQYEGQTGVFTADGLQHAPSSGAFTKNWTTNAFFSEAALRARFDAAYRNHTVYVQMLHYWDFHSKGRLAKLRQLIGYMKSRGGVKFMTLGQLHRGLVNGDVKRTATGWKVLEPRRDGRSGSTTDGGSNHTTAVDTLLVREPRRSGVDPRRAGAHPRHAGAHT